MVFGFDDAPRRDSRRPTESQRNVIWDRQGGRCAQCGQPLMRSATHYDHKKRWSKGGPTTIGNCRALCPNCHAVKTNKERARDVESSRRKQREPSLFGIGPSSNLRLPRSGGVSIFSGPSIFDPPKRRKKKQKGPFDF